MERSSVEGAGNAAVRLAQLSARLASVRQSDRDRYGHFFSTLGERLAVAKAVERELDPLLARRFNALDYLRHDELGLSKIVADLLNPSSAHGQGSAFLKLFIKMIDPPQWLAESAAPIDDCDVRVVPERRIDHGGRLDISVEFRMRGQEPTCIAIENKPYAADGEAQIEDYLKFLRGQYCGRFLLVYLSPHGGRPSNVSLPEGACEDGLATMSYCLAPPEGTGENLPLRLPFSLTDWLLECRRSCDAERLRWFLREAESFCHKTFGGTVTTTSEQRVVRDFILESDDNVLTAIAVAEIWPETRNDVVKQFLKVFCERITDDVHAIGDLQVNSDFTAGRVRGPQDGVRLFRTAWSMGSSPPPVVRLSPDIGLSNWSVGVNFEPDSSDADVGERLRERLQRAMPSDAKRYAAWPWYSYLEKHRNWDQLVASLHKETKSPGELTEYFSCCLIAAAGWMVPIIDEVVTGDH